MNRIKFGQEILVSVHPETPDFSGLTNINKKSTGSEIKDRPIFSKNGQLLRRLFGRVIFSLNFCAMVPRMFARLDLHLNRRVVLSYGSQSF